MNLKQNIVPTSTLLFVHDPLATTSNKEISLQNPQENQKLFQKNIVELFTYFNPMVLRCQS